MKIKLWSRPYNGGWIWFDKSQAGRFSYGWHKPKLWWCIFGFCGCITIQTWPWQKRPK